MPGDIFDPSAAGIPAAKGGNLGKKLEQGSAPGNLDDGEFQYVSFDNETGELTINLPAEVGEHRDALQQAIIEEFYLTAPDRETRQDINSFIAAWLREHGIEPQGKDKDDTSKPRGRLGPIS